MSELKLNLELDYLPKICGDLPTQLEFNKENSWPDLSYQLQAFCFEYTEHFNAKKAAKAVDLPQTHAYRILRNPLVSAYLDQMQEQSRQISIISKEFVEQEILDNYMKQSGQEEVSRMNRDGEVTTGLDYNATGTNQLLKEMGKISKVYPDGMGGAGGVTVNINLAALGMGGASIPGGPIIEQSKEPVLTIEIPPDELRDSTEELETSPESE